MGRAYPQVIHGLAAVRAHRCASPLFEQLLATPALEHMDDILVERRQAIRLRRAALTRALDARVATWRYAPPSGGMLGWAQLPGSISNELVAGRARGTCTPGRRFAAGMLERHLRLPFTLAPWQLERAVEIMAALSPGRPPRRRRENSIHRLGERPRPYVIQVAITSLRGDAAPAGPDRRNARRVPLRDRPDPRRGRAAPVPSAPGRPQLPVAEVNSA